MSMKKIKNNFFGEICNCSNKRFTFDGTAHDNEDLVTVITGNVRRYKDGYVLVVGNSEVVFLKDWQICPIYNHETVGNAFAVKLDRKFFRTYTWKSYFPDFGFDESDTFDSLKKAAKEQAHQLHWKQGHYGKKVNIEWLEWNRDNSAQ